MLKGIWRVFPDQHLYLIRFVGRKSTLSLLPSLLVHRIDEFIIKEISFKWITENSFIFCFRRVPNAKRGEK